MCVNWRFWVSGICVCAVLGASVVPTSADSWIPIFGTPTSIEKLAANIDVLEKHIDCYGSVVAKAPDIWGQARLTRHRDEFEKEMFKDVGAFKDNLNAAISRSDQAFLASALALTNAAGGIKENEQKGTFSTVQTFITDPTNQTTGDATVINRTAPFATLEPGVSARFKVTGVDGLSLEPSIHLDQKARYLNHLHELRRINEGDDTADSPGYSLNLVRIPISVTPGRKTRKGYGAEITISATPYISDELLPHTFRSLVINDLVDVLSFKIARVVEIVANATSNPEAAAESTTAPPPAPAPQGNSRRRNDHGRVIPASAVMLTAAAVPFEMRSEQFKSFVQQRQPGLSSKAVQSKSDSAAKVLRGAVEKAVRAVNHGRVRRSRSPVPPTQLSAVIGVDELETLAVFVANALGDQIREPHNQPNLLDVRALLRDELDGAYDLMALPEKAHLWHSVPEIVPDLLAAIRGGDPSALDSRRNRFMNDVNVDHDSTDAFDVTRALAWAILVESTLLNEQLVQDMKRLASEKNCPCAAAGPMPFFLPDPPPEARMAFAEYVKCRWPIHVFALDPVTQDQNIVDSFSRRRELQLAMALAFSSGQLSAQSMTRFVRRLELDMETIALNRTIVGFSHGNETFGWRFYPRVQTPSEESNATVVFRDMLWGGPTRDDDLRQRQLEPGMRECTAIVIMPSFVPYVTIDTRSNWFPLTNCGKAELSIKDAVRLSKLIRSMQNTVEACVRDAHKYRDGDVYRLLKRVDQLSAELPMQTQIAQVPYENTLGGFEMFSNGTSDLAPQLLGYYGEPGIDPAGDTELFLIGDHFSVHDTRVIAGNVSIQPQLLSRQVMQVKIPKGVRCQKKINPGNPASGESDSKDVPYVVDVHVATPYGISNHIEIPIATEQCPKPPASSNAADATFKWTAKKQPVDVKYSYSVEMDAAGKPTFKLKSADGVSSDDYKIGIPCKAIDLGPATLQLTFVSVSGTNKRLITSLSIDLEEAKYDAIGAEYRIDGKNLVTLHQQLASKLLELYGTSDKPPSTDDVKEILVQAKFKGITGISNSPPITNDLRLNIQWNPPKKSAAETASK